MKNSKYLKKTLLKDNDNDNHQMKYFTYNNVHCTSLLRSATVLFFNFDGQREI